MECGRSKSGKGWVEKVLKGRWLEEAVFMASIVIIRSYLKFGFGSERR